MHGSPLRLAKGIKEANAFLRLGNFNKCECRTVAFAAFAVLRHVDAFVAASDEEQGCHKKESYINARGVPSARPTRRLAPCG